MKTLLKNVILNGEKTSILIENSKFAAIAPDLSAEDADIIDANGKLAALPPFYGKDRVSLRPTVFGALFLSFGGRTEAGYRTFLCASAWLYAYGALQKLFCARQWC